MFNWLKRRRRELQDDTDCLQAYFEAQRRLAEIEEKRAGEEAADRVVKAFAAMLETTHDWILDVRDLPYPKETIRAAFAKRIAFYKDYCRQVPNETWCRRRLEVHKLAALSLSDFQTIDAEDEAAVRAANAMSWSDPERLRLFGGYFIKYFERAIKEDELIVDSPLELAEKRAYLETVRRVVPR